MKFMTGVVVVVTLIALGVDAESTNGGNSHNTTESTNGENSHNTTESTNGENSHNTTESTNGGNSHNTTESTNGGNSHNTTESTNGGNSHNTTESTNGENSHNTTESTNGGNSHNTTESTNGENSHNTTESTNGENSENTTESSLEEEDEAAKAKRCSDMIGVFWDDAGWVGLEVEYDIKGLLEKYGGPPGKVNATWVEKKDAPVAENATDERPLPIADEQYWLYSFTALDGKTFARGEHAVHRFSGSPKEFLEIRGVLLWIPEDFCGRGRKVTYVVDDRGFTFKVSREYCWIYKDDYRCAMPGFCKHNPDGSISCVAAPYGGLYASLVGGGK